MPIEDEIRLFIALSSLMLTGREISSIMFKASVRARLNAEMMTTGCIFRSSCGKACASISPAGLIRLMFCTQAAAAYLR